MVCYVVVVVFLPTAHTTPPRHLTSAQQTKSKRVLRQSTRLYDDVLVQKPLENVTVSDPTQYLYTVPWLDPNAHTRPYIGLHNNFDELLRVQASQDGIITWTFYTNVWRTLLMNFAFSLMRYGKVTSFIVVTLDEPSLRTCMGLRLPCYNASSTAPLIVGMGLLVHALILYYNTHNRPL